MSIYLLKEVKKFRADSQNEAERIVSTMKSKFDVAGQRIIRKDKKDETYFIVEITVVENSEKEPHTSYGLI